MDINNAFHLNRIDELVSSLTKMAVQSGRVPDKDAFNLMATELESDLDNSIDVPLLKETLDSLRRKMVGYPRPSHINEEALAIASRKHEGVRVLPPPTRSTKEICQWEELAAMRILGRQNSGIPHTDPWYATMLSGKPTLNESNGFLRMFRRNCKRNNYEALADFWGPRNPYHLTADEIKIFTLTLEYPHVAKGDRL